MDLELQRKLVTEGLTPSAQSTSEAAERKVEWTPRVRSCDRCGHKARRVHGSLAVLGIDSLAWQVLFLMPPFQYLITEILEGPCGHLDVQLRVSYRVCTLTALTITKENVLDAQDPKRTCSSF